MNFTTCLLPTHRHPVPHNPSTTVNDSADLAVVIDVLRATSVIVTAFHGGASQMMTCREVTEAREIADSLRPSPLLGGERGCQPIPGFDMGNSPAEYSADRVRGRTIVMTTTNGTQAISIAVEIPRVIVASFLNLSAVVDVVAQCERVELICAGTEGHVTLEDVLLAGAILWRHQLRTSGNRQDVVLDDGSVLALQLWRSWFPDATASGAMPDTDSLSRRLRETRGGRNLLRLGFDADLIRCAQIDSMHVVPERVATSPATFSLSR